MATWILGAAIGGAVGSVLRFSLILKIAQSWPMYPYATLGVNVVGCFGMGMVVAWFHSRGAAGVGFWYAMIAAGLLGGLTTFSTFAFDFWMLARRDGLSWAGGYLLITLICSLGAFWLGEELVVTRQY